MASYLNTSSKARKRIGDTMSYQLPIDIQIVLAGRYAQGRDIDRNMKDAKKREGKHSRDGINKSRPIDGRKIYTVRKNQVNKAMTYHKVCRNGTTG